MCSHVQEIASVCILASVFKMGVGFRFRIYADDAVFLVHSLSRMNYINGFPNIELSFLSSVFPDPISCSYAQPTCSCPHQSVFHAEQFLHSAGLWPSPETPAPSPPELS